MRKHRTVNLPGLARASLCFMSSLVIGISASASFDAGNHSILLIAAGILACTGVLRWHCRAARRRANSERLSRTVLRSTQRAAVRRSSWRVITPHYRRDVTASLERSASVRAQYATLVTLDLQ